MVVELPGPPAVISQMIVKLPSDSSVISRALVISVGLSSGNVIPQTFRIPPTPSIVAASFTSAGMLRNAAPKRSIVSPARDQVLARLTNTMGAAKSGSEPGLPNSVAKVPPGTDAAYQMTAIVTGG